MTGVPVYLGGEGANELGSWAKDRAYWSDHELGVIEELLGRVQEQGWHVIGATKWSKIRKLRPGGHLSAEERNVLGLVLDAREAKAKLVAFVRDEDDRCERTEAIRDALAAARERFADVEVIGGVAVPVLEGWILALKGQRGTEELGKRAAQTKLRELGIDKDTALMVEVVENAELERLPADAKSLHRWLEGARDALPRKVGEAERVKDPRAVE